MQNINKSIFFDLSNGSQRLQEKLLISLINYAVPFFIQQIYNHYPIFFEEYSNIQLLKSPRQQCARKQFTQQQVKYFYNSNIFEDRKQNYDPSLFDRSQIMQQAKIHKQTYSPPISSNIQRINNSPFSKIELDIITGLPIYEKKMFLSKKLSSKPLHEKKDSNQENKIKSKKEFENSPENKKFASLYFDNKKQYEQWLKQNKKYEDINYFNKQNTNKNNEAEVEGNSYFKIHGKNCNQIQNK